jgi:hypothetical protein
LNGPRSETSTTFKAARTWQAGRDPDLGDLPAGDVLVTDGVITAVGQDLTPASAAP